MAPQAQVGSTSTSAPTPTPTPTSRSTLTQTSPSRTRSSIAKVTTPILNFETPALTTTFTPPPSCTQGHITMLMSAAYQIWLNEPRPVPNTTFSDCYPSQFMTSFLQSASSTILPAFSPLVCPDNYLTIFNRTVTDRPLYVACCPSNYGFHPPDTSTPGRPGYGGTCYSDILSVSVTQYDNSSSSGVMLFSTSGQAYAHPIDGFALETASDKITVVSTAIGAATPLAATSSAASKSTDSTSHTGLIIGLVVGLGIGAGLVLAAGLFILRSRRRKGRQTSADGSNSEHSKENPPPPWSPANGAKELPSPPPVVKPDPINKMFRSELSDGQTQGVEMPLHPDPPTELDGGYPHARTN